MRKFSNWGFPEQEYQPKGALEVSPKLISLKVVKKTLAH